MGSSQCCAMAPSTQVTVKVNFSRRDLSTSARLASALFSQELAVPSPEWSLQLGTRLGSNFFALLDDLQYVLSNLVLLKPKAERLLLYETKHGLIVHPLAAYDSPQQRAKVTLGSLMYDLSFVDWTSGYALVVWFDARLFTPVLDVAIQEANYDKTRQILEAIVWQKTHGIPAEESQPRTEHPLGLIQKPDELLLRESRRAVRGKESPPIWQPTRGLRQMNISAEFFFQRVLPLERYPFELSCSDTRKLLTLEGESGAQCSAYFAAKMVGPHFSEFVTREAVLRCAMLGHFETIENLVSWDCKAAMCVTLPSSLAKEEEEVYGDPRLGLLCRKGGADALDAKKNGTNVSKG